MALLNHYTLQRESRRRFYKKVYAPSLSADFDVPWFWHFSYSPPATDGLGKDLGRA